MTPYHERQTGWLLIVPAILMFVFLTVLYAFQLGDRPLTPVSYLLAAGFLFLMVALMGRMTTEVTEQHVAVRFGVGLIRRIIPVSDIQSATVVTNAWYYGWGIRMIPNGWLYNVSGAKGIELRLKTGRVARIGSRSPEALAQVIANLISSQKAQN